MAGNTEVKNLALNTLKVLLTSILILAIMTPPVLAMNTVNPTNSYDPTPVLAPATPGDLNKSNLLSFPKNNSWWFTFDRNSNITGPAINYFSENSTEKINDNSTYVQKIFGYLVQEAHRYASEFYDIESRQNNTNWSYYSFLVLALTVPSHESSLNHFRYALGKHCSTISNQLLNKKGPRNTQKLIRKHYRVRGKEIFPNCNSFEKTEVVKQALWSGFYDDVGLWQINPQHHPETIRPHTYLSIYNTIDYGVRFLFEGMNYTGSRGFKGVLSKISKYDKFSKNGYTCNMIENPFSTKNYNQKTRPRSYYNLLRGTWAGQYNSGNTYASSVCRFHLKPKGISYSNGSAGKPDKHFKNNLDKIILSDSSIYHRYLPKNSLEYAALQEIVNNYRSIFLSSNRLPEQHTALDQLLKTRYKNKDLAENEYSIKMDRIPVFSRNNYSNKFICGYINKSNQIGINKLTSVYQVNYDERLSQILGFDFKTQFHKIERPEYFERKDKLVIVKGIASLARGINSENIRTTPEYRSKDPLFNLHKQYKFSRDKSDTFKTTGKVNGPWTEIIVGTTEKAWVFSKSIQIKPLITPEKDPNKCIQSDQFWVQGQLLSKTMSPSVKITDVGYVFISDDQVTVPVYGRPTAGGKIVEILPPGKRLLKIAETERFYRVIRPNHPECLGTNMYEKSFCEAWISKSNLQLVNDSPIDEPGI